MAYVRTVKTASGARAVQIVHSQHRGSRNIEHIGSAHTDADLELLKAVARQRLAAGQGELDLRLPDSPANKGAALPVTSSRMGHLLDALTCGYGALGFAAATGRDEVFRSLVLARIIEPTSKLDSLRVLDEAGHEAPSYRTVKRRLRVYADADASGDGAEVAEAGDSAVQAVAVDPAGGRWRARLARACADHVRLGPATLLLDLPDVTVVADAGMVSDANKKAIEAAGLSFILGARIPDVPFVVADWRKAHPDTDIDDGQIFIQPWPAGPTDKRRDHTFIYQYKTDRARRTLRGIDQQITKAENAVAGKVPVKRNRYVQLTGATKSVNRDLEAKNRALAGIKGYVTNLPDPEPQQVIGAYSRLLQVEKSFRMSKSDLAARPIYHHTRESIEAHLTIVFAALAVSRWIENRTGWSIKRFVTTARRYRTIQIQAGEHTLTAADPVPDDLQAALDTIYDTH
ncbi:IS1634 family transposase [Lentzea flava]|uniref:IS1634 family transposase n=1 Tax=Lentzea flava TaxID=103732 RepID=UPI00166F6A3D